MNDCLDLVVAGRAILIKNVEAEIYFGRGKYF